MSESETIIIRHVLERQIAVGQALGGRLIDAATDVSTALAHAPATFAGAIQDGETIAAAWERTGAGVQDVVDEARSRLRGAVISYVGHQATLPVAVLGYAGEVAGAALDGAFAVVSAATHGDDVRAALSHNIEEVRATAAAARGDVNESVKRAGQEVREAVGGELDPLVTAITGTGEDS